MIGNIMAGAAKKDAYSADHRQPGQTVTIGVSFSETPEITQLLDEKSFEDLAGSLVASRLLSQL